MYRRTTGAKFVDFENGHVYAGDTAGVCLFLSVYQVNIGKAGKSCEPSHETTSCVDP
jgi:hypothetical protein